MVPVEPSGDVMVPVANAASAWRKNSNPLAADLLGDATLTATPLFAQGERAPKDVQTSALW